MTVNIVRAAPRKLSYIEQAKLKKAMEREARDAQYDAQHQNVSRLPSATEQMRAIEYFFRTYRGPGEFV